MSAAMPMLRNRPLPGAATLAIALILLGPAGSAQAVSSAAATKPASAAKSAGGTGAPASTGAAATPTTTYVPSGSTPAPVTTPSAATTTPTVSIPAVVSTHAAPTTPAHPTASKGDRPLSSGAIVIAALAALLVLVCAAWGLARWSAFEPHWLLSLRHAMAEAGFRASATWTEFADWVRLGH
jgi:hypothetical protein